MRALLGALSVALIVLYPGLVYYGLTHWRTRLTVLVLLPVLLFRGLLSLGTSGRSQLRAMAHVPLLIAGLLGLAALLNRPDSMLATPVLINTVLCATFAASLRTVPMVERFARLHEPELPDEAVRYCRTVTYVWCWFFVFNAAIAGTLAWIGPLAWWALFTGIVSYVLMGSLFVVEFVYRKYRFRRYGAGLADRIFVRIFPPRQSNS